jgi:hypothetical protein
MTPRIRSLVAAEPLVPSQFRALSAPFIFREFVETLQRLHDSPQEFEPVKPKANGRTKVKSRRARKVSK